MTFVDSKKDWDLSAKEKDLIRGKTPSGQLLFCVLLKFYQSEGLFPIELDSLPEGMLDYFCAQLSIPISLSRDLFSSERSLRNYRMEIRSHFGIHRFDQQRKDSFQKWLQEVLFPQGLSATAQEEEISLWFLEHLVEKPSPPVLQRFLGSRETFFEKCLFSEISKKLSSSQKERLDSLLEIREDVSEFQKLREEGGSVSLESILKSMDRLKLLRKIDLPGNLIEHLSSNLVEKYRLRASSEGSWELKRHPDFIRWSLLCFFCIPREAEIIDHLIDLLLSLTHKISTQAEKRVIKEFVGSLTKVHGKTNLLFRMAEASSENPEGTVRDVIFPVVGEKTILSLVQEYRADGPAYSKKIYRKMRLSYAQHYRKMLPQILKTLEFCSNNSHWRPLLEAISILKDETLSGARYFATEDVPIEGIVRSKWRDSVIEEGPNNSNRINRINYELCVLQSLREKLRCKEIFVKGAQRFCNPDQDLPQDFEENRAAYYQKLDQPLSGKTFIEILQKKMEFALKAFNDNLPKDPFVRLKTKGGKTLVSVTPLKAQLAPPNIDALKRELQNRWPATSLLDILKETNLRTNFVQSFASSASRQSMDEKEVTRKLLLSLYGLGTNIGLKALTSGPSGVSYKELLHLKRRFIHRDSLRQATRMVVNATLKERLPGIWGTGTTSCASDSTQFAAWDQNLMTEWHQRYGGRGIMIYWHVDAKSTCIYSQLKKCSSSEVAAMIEGVLHHCTEMEIDRHYVDTHGQSIIAFAFCYLLRFDLMPRFKGINKQKLARPFPKIEGDYPNIEPLFYKAPINWTLIEQQYDEIIKLATALLERTAHPEAILRRFTRGVTKHPAYAALLELGKAAKTIFLCKYLSSEELRREIQVGLNVIERWNGVNGFIHFGKSGEFSSNRVEDQEIFVLALHLLQASLVYLNTIMIQEVLRDPVWKNKLTQRDKEALSPLPYSHINPYGDFDLDMNQRLPLEEFKRAA